MPISANCEVAIVGGGPAGAIAALYLAQGGARVILLEKRALPRYKVCGGGLSRKAFLLLPQKPTKIIEDSITEVVFLHREGHPLTVSLEEPVMFMVMRDRFDQWLLQLAEQAGATVYPQNEVETIENNGDTVTLSTSLSRITSRLVIAADGAYGRTARAMGIEVPLRRGLAVESELPLDPGQPSDYHGRVFINYGSIKQGYSWLFPKLSHLSVGSGSFCPHAPSILETTSKFCHYMKIAPPVRSQLRAHPLPVLSGPPEALHTSRCLAVGDAGGLIDPFCGEGIYYSLVSGIRASEAALRFLRGETEALAGYSQGIRRELWPELEAATRLARVIYGFPSLVHLLLEKHPEAASWLVGVIFGSRTYRDLYRNLYERFPLFR